MKQPLVPYLRCPVCKRANLTLVGDASKSDCIMTGELECQSCQKRYPITDGIPEVVADVSREVLSEIHAHEAEEFDPEVLRRLPYISDPKAPGHWESIAANFQQALDLVPATLEGKRVLDIGAGTCWASAAFAARGATVVALDISRHRLNAGRSLLDKNRDFQRLAADMCDLPLADELFDVVVSFATVHHADDLEKVFGEIHRVMVPGGIGLIVGEPVHSVFSRAPDFGAEAIEKGMNEHSYTYGQYQDAARRCGFSVQTVFPASIQEQLDGAAYAPPTNRRRIIKALLPGKLRRYLLPLGYRLINSLVLTMAIHRR